MAAAATFFLLHLLLINFFSSSADDAVVMSKLLSSFSPTPSGWSSTTHFCKWKNVNCDRTNSFVTSINITSHSLSGTLPSELNQLSQLITINLRQNSLSGTLPSFANMTSLREISLDSNKFESIPQNFLMGLSNLHSFTMDDNSKLSPWEIPLYLIDSQGLGTFHACNASLTGSIPDIFSAFPGLQSLKLSYNNLTGSLPPSFGHSSIASLFLNNQSLGLSGMLDVLSSMTQLYDVWLHANAFIGPIPDLSDCKHLFYLHLCDNRLTGLVPPSLTKLPFLSSITLQNNKLQGPMPEFANGVWYNNSFCKDTTGPCDQQVTALLDVASVIGYPILLADSWQGNDACNDWKFIVCDSQKVNVTGVNFGKQRFSGSISPAFTNLTSLRSLILNDNNLSGIIPNVLITLPQLQTFDVSNNNLFGPIPIFAASVKFIHGGNEFLNNNVSDGEPYGSQFGGKKGSSVSIGLIIGVVVVVVSVVGFLLFVSYKFYARKHLKSFGGIQDSEMAVFEGGNVVIFVQVLREVTNNFSDENVLGRGGFGIVYKGELPDGRKIAVKRMESGAMGTKGMKEFQAEIAVLTKVRHRHLVALLGYCINGNERLLVYEYMPQGTLSQHLFKWQQNGTRPLTWKERVTIAYDVARGVEYLHSLAQQSFIHRDLKPSNILLGDDMRAKVADFGLVRKAPNGNYSVETRLAGTFGYLAPEYTATGRVTTKVDVYAFGVVLMEIITGRKAVDETVLDEMSHLVTWFRRVLINKDKLRKAIDLTLDSDGETYENICKVAKLAGHCTCPKPFQRPDMAHVVNVLGALVEQWKPSNHDEEEGNGIDRHMSLPKDLLIWQSDEASWMTLDDFSYRLTHSSIL